MYYPARTIVHRHEKGSYKSARLLFCGIKSAVKYFNKWGWVVDRERDAINRRIGPLENLRLPMEQKHNTARSVLVHIRCGAEPLKIFSMARIKIYFQRGSFKMSWYKRWFDILLSFGLIVCLAPLYLAIACAG